MTAIVERTHQPAIDIASAPGALAKATDDLKALSEIAAAQARITALLMQAEADCASDPGACDRHSIVLQQLASSVRALLASVSGSRSGSGAVSGSGAGSGLLRNALGALQQLRARVEGVDGDRARAAVENLHLDRKLTSAIATCLQKPDDAVFRKAIFDGLRHDVSDMLHAAMESKSIIVAVMAVMSTLISRCDLQLRDMADDRLGRQGRLGDLQSVVRALESSVDGHELIDEGLPIELGDLEIPLHRDSPMRAAGFTGETAKLSEMSAFYGEKIRGFSTVPATLGGARSAIKGLNDTIGMEASALSHEEMLDMQTLLTQKRVASEAATSSASRMEKTYESIFAR